MAVGIYILTLMGCFLGLPLAALAKEERPISAEFSLTASNGYLVSVVGSRHEVVINVSKREVQSSQSAETVYSVPAAVTRRAIYANLGALGEISMQFIPSGGIINKKRSRLPKGCKGVRRIVRERGTFVGVFRFEGETSYATANATEVSGSIGTPDDMFCGNFINGLDEGKRQRRTRSPAPSPYLDAGAANNAVGFAAALVGHERKRATFVASSTEKSGAISIVRWASVVASRSDFDFDRRLTTARVTPPLPFSGTATFHRGHNGKPPSWTGSLTVSFPGAPGIPLTGLDFRATIFPRL